MSRDERAEGHGLQAGGMRLLPALLLFCAVLAPSAAPGSDNDERPAYMIYLDPETGQYTTEDPLRSLQADDDEGEPAPPSSAAGGATESSGPQAGGDGATGRSAGTVLIAAAILLLAALAWGIRRKRHGRIPGEL